MQSWISDTVSLIVVYDIKDTTEGYLLRANNVYGLQIMVISLLW